MVVPVAQLDRASDYGSEGWKFDFSWERFVCSCNSIEQKFCLLSRKLGV